jgi:hypothetical protein
MVREHEAYRGAKVKSTLLLMYLSKHQAHNGSEHSRGVDLVMPQIMFQVRQCRIVVLSRNLEHNSIVSKKLGDIES